MSHKRRTSIEHPFAVSQVIRSVYFSLVFPVAKGLILLAFHSPACRTVALSAKSLSVFWLVLTLCDHLVTI